MGRAFQAVGTANTKAHKKKIQSVHQSLKGHIKGPLASCSDIIIVKRTHCIHGQEGEIKASLYHEMTTKSETSDPILVLKLNKDLSPFLRVE